MAVEQQSVRTGTSKGESRTRYALCGLSSRAIGMYALPLLGNPEMSQYGDFSRYGELVAILDIDPERVQAFNEAQATDVPVYTPGEFGSMVQESRPEVVIVASVDGTHAEYIIQALENDLNVITEKPMVIDARQAASVLEAERRSRGNVRVIHNSRYAQPHMQIKRMVQSGMLGRITNVEFVWNLDTYHGASYFRRWNRDRSQSGGLTITKGCHHFDLINWWLDDVPEQVFAYGALNYYGAKSPYNPSKEGQHLSIEEQKRLSPYHQRWHAHGLPAPHDDHLKVRDRTFNLPYNVQYPPEKPMYIFDEEIQIEDTYSAVVRYRGGASMTYSSNFSAPWEGYQLGINGTRGRLESVHLTDPSRCPFPASDRQTITYYPLFGERQVYETRRVQGGHGGADTLLKQEIFVEPLAESAELGLEASSLEGAYAVAVGEAIWRSVESNQPVSISDLLDTDSNRGKEN